MRASTACPHMQEIGLYVRQLKIMTLALYFGENFTTAVFCERDVNFMQQPGFQSKISKYVPSCVVPV